MEGSQTHLHRMGNLGLCRPLHVSLKLFQDGPTPQDLLTSGASMVAACHTATSYFNLWLKDVGYGTVDANIYPTAGSALNIVATVTWGIIADRTGQNYLMVVIVQVLMILSNILLSVWYIPKGALMFAFYLSYAGSAATPVLIVSQF